MISGTALPRDIRNRHLYFFLSHIQFLQAMTIKMKTEPSKCHWAEEGEGAEAKANKLWSKTGEFILSRKLIHFTFNLRQNLGRVEEFLICLV